MVSLARLVIPIIIIILAMPPKSAGLNPVENVLQFIHDRRLSNRVFKFYEDFNHCCES